MPTCDKVSGLSDAVNGFQCVLPFDPMLGFCSGRWEEYDFEWTSYRPSYATPVFCGEGEERPRTAWDPCHGTPMAREPNDVLVRETEVEGGYGPNVPLRRP